MEEKINILQEFLDKGLELENQITEYGNKIRKLSKENYGRDLLDARIIMISILSDLIAIRERVPGKTNKSISERINLIAGFIQGIDITESAISEGQYLKAAAIEKQNYEVLIRISEVKKGVQKKGRTPQAKYLPEGLRRINGDLNKIAHPSYDEVIQDLLQKIETDSITSVSYLPQFKKDISKRMYELHLIIMFNMIEECVSVLLEMYGNELLGDFMERNLLEYLEFARHKLKESGAVITSK